MRVYGPFAGESRVEVERLEDGVERRGTDQRPRIRGEAIVCVSVSCARVQARAGKGERRGTRKLDGQPR